MKFANLPPTKQVGSYQWNHQALLGQGAYGKVYLGKDSKKPEQYLAIKVLENKEMNDPYLQQSLKNEIEILQTLKGPHTIGLIDYLKTSSRSYIIQKFCNGGDVRTFLTKKGYVPEAQAIKLFQQILQGYYELYQHGFVHRDLKPENFLIDNNDFVVADYGFTVKVKDYQNERLTDMVGTPLYMSPQILQNIKYTTKSDIYSLGIIFYEILYGKTPFPAQTMDELIQNTMRLQLKFPYNIPVSESTKQLIRACLQKDENLRLNWTELFKHPIFTQAQQQVAEQANKVDTARFTKEQRQVIMLLQQQVEKKSIDVQKLFIQFANGNNFLFFNEFYSLTKFLIKDLAQDTVFELFKQIDVSGDGKINQDEFQLLLLHTDFMDDSQQKDNDMLIQLRAKQCLKKLRQIVKQFNINVHEVFKKLDKSGDSLLDVNELELYLKQIDNQISRPEVEYLFKIFDQDKSGTMSLSEFYNLLVEKQSTNQQQIVDNQQMLKLSVNSQNVVSQLKKIIIQNDLDLNQIFNNFDKDNSGSLNQNEFSQMIRIVNDNLSDKEINEIFKYFDTDNGGNVSILEFKNILS